MSWFSPSRLRLILLGALFAVAVMVLVVRLWTLQIKRRADFIERIPGTSTVTVRVPATRGRIMDRDGRLLVDNVVRYEAAFDLEALKKAFRKESGKDEPTTTYDVPVRGSINLKKNEEADIVSIFKEMALPRLDLVGLAEDFNAGQMKVHYRTHKGLIPWVYRDSLSYDEFAKFAENAGLVPGLSANFRPQRRYLYGALAAHIIGFMKVPETSQLPLEERRLFDHFVPDDIGASGIEQTFEDLLRGRPGRRTLKKDEKGHVLGVIGYEPPARGGDTYLTLDAELQMLAEQTMRNVGRGAAVVVDVKSGDILALASVPSYDPNDFVPRITQEKYEAYTKDPTEPLFCTALGSYEPGSTYKIMSAVAGALGGKGGASFNCSGGVTFGTKFKKCWIFDHGGGGHGTLALPEAIQRSCNAYFYQLGNAVGPKPFVRAAEMLGFGRPSGIELVNESPGIVMGGEYWREVLRRDPQRGMTPAELANMVIGQGETKTTPIQIVMMTAAIANGGKVLHPRLVRKILDPDNKMIFPDGRDGRTMVDQPSVACDLLADGVPESALEKIRLGMFMAVNQAGGTAGAVKIEGLGVCGKTGSAQTTIRGKKGTHAWFMGFAPKDNPKYAICVMVLGGKAGGKVAAPLGRAILEGTFAIERDRISPGTGTRPGLVPLTAAPGNYNAIEEIKRDPKTGQITVIADAASLPEVRPARLISTPAATIREAPDAEGRVVRRAKPVPESAPAPAGSNN